MDETPAFSRTDLRLLVQSGDLEAGEYKRALDVFRDPRAWDKWALAALFALGVGHILAGVVFFFAFNWNDLSGPMKFGIVQGGLGGSVLLWLALKFDTALAQAFGIAATILIGVFLAVFGQVFQTPAAIYTPFILWAALSFPFAAASRSVAHWAVWLSIAVFAALTFIGDGIMQTSGKAAARWGFLVLGTGLLGVSALYHWVSRHKLPWARTSWFKLAILVTAFFILFGVFTESFWQNSFDVVWVLCLAVSGAALAAIYKKWPTLPALSLTTFAIAAMASQLGFRAIVEVLDGLNFFDALFAHLLFMFIWALGVTFLLAKAFRHYQTRFGITPKDKAVHADTPGAFGLPLSSFSKAMGLEETKLEDVFAAESEEAAPWYIDTLLGFAGVITALFALFLLGSFVALFLSGDAPLAYAAFGFVIWAGAVIFRLRVNAKFTKHFFNMFVLGGGGLAIGALAAEFEGAIGFIIFGLTISLITLFLVRDRIIEFLMALGIFGLVSYGLYEFDIPRPYIWACIIFTALAVAGLVWPVRNRLYDAAGAAFLLVIPIASATYDKGASLEGLGLKANWPEMAISVVAAIAAVFFLNRVNKQQATFRPPLAVFIPLLAAMAIMPLGSAAALLVVLVGYILGSRALALIGVLIQIYFLSLFYYDLQITLLSKSILLVISGLIFVGVWWFFQKLRENVHV